VGRQDPDRRTLIIGRDYRMRCNQRFFGQEHFERGTAERDFCSSLGVLKPAMSQYGFALKDRLPELPVEVGGLAQVKYNGMLSVVMWDEQRGGFVAWSPRGRCYYSLSGEKRHPVIEYFNERSSEFRDYAFEGETYVVRMIGGKSYMTEFNDTMSIIKNPASKKDVSRIRLAVFDYAKIGLDGGFERPVPSYVDRFRNLLDDFKFPAGCDSGVVHLPDFLRVEGSFEDSRDEIQPFWNEFIGDRGFEGLVVHTDNGEDYKIKFRDTLDVAIIAFRMRGNGRPTCKSCGGRFDTFWLRKLAREGVVERSDWFDQKGRLLKGQGGPWVHMRDTGSCPLCGGDISKTAGPIFGAKIALMTAEGDFVDVADGAQLSAISPILDLVEPLYEAEGYLWVKPEVVIEVSYQQLYVDSPRPVYRFEKGRYKRIGTRKAVSLRPYGPQLREDKTVNPRDLRLEQVSYFVERAKSIQEKWLKATGKQDVLTGYLG